MKLAVCTAGLLALAGSAQATITATAELTGVPIAGGMTHYTGVVTNTGDTTVGTFWFAWIPLYDFMPTAPTNIVAPPGWTFVVESGGFESGYSILWYATSAAGDIPVGGPPLSGFAFDSASSVATLSGHTADGRYVIATSYVYIGQPETDPGYTFTASVVAGSAPCYANCDGSTTVPLLNVSDFTCFLQKFAQGDAYANCDGSTSRASSSTLRGDVRNGRRKEPEKSPHLTRS
jgi:hypothetical protein